MIYLTYIEKFCQVTTASMRPLVEFLGKIASADDLGLAVAASSQVVVLHRIFDFEAWTLPASIIGDIKSVKEAPRDQKIFAIFNALSAGLSASL